MIYTKGSRLQFLMELGFKLIIGGIFGLIGYYVFNHVSPPVFVGICVGMFGFTGASISFLVDHVTNKFK